MERKNHGRGSALTMRLASMHVCVLLEFVERFYAGIDGFQCVCSTGICWKIICWNWWFSMCVMLEFVERLYAGIDGFNVCVLLEFVERLYATIDGFQCVFFARICWMLEFMVFNVCILLEFVEILYAGIDGFNVCVLLELSDSLCVGVVTACVCVHAESCVLQRILWFAAEVEWSAANLWFATVCSELAFAAKMCVLQRICDSLPKLSCLQRICDSLPKLNWLLRISIHCWIACSAAKLWFAAEVVLFCSEFVTRCRNWVVCSEVAFAAAKHVGCSDIAFAVELAACIEPVFAANFYNRPPRHKWLKC